MRGVCLGVLVVGLAVLVGSAGAGPSAGAGDATTVVDDDLLDGPRAACPRRIAPPGLATGVDSGCLAVASGRRSST